MIVIEHLEIVRFKGVREATLHLPERGTFLIEGNNEAGKSTIFESIYFALYGRPLNGTLADHIPHDGADVEVRIRLRIDRPGAPPDILDITRTIVAGRTQATAGVRLRVERGNDHEEVRRVSDANRRIALELGGLTADTFTNSCFVPQKQLGGLETLDRSQREAAVAALLNLDRLTRAAQSFAIRPVDHDDLRRHEARLALAEATRAVDAADDRRARAEAALRRLDLRDALASFRDATAREAEASKRITDATQRRLAAEARVSAADGAHGAVRAWRAVREAIRALEEATTSARQATVRHDAATLAQTALPAAIAHLDAARDAEARATSVKFWLDEGRRAVLEDIRAINARRVARTRARAELDDATDQLTKIDAEMAALNARREALRPRLATRDRARQRRVTIDALRDAVALAETRRREVVDASAAVAARTSADARVIEARRRVSEADTHLAPGREARGAIAARAHLTAVRDALAAAIEARDTLLAARTRNDRLRDLILGVLDAAPQPDGRLSLRLLIDHQTIGARVIDLTLDADDGITATSRTASHDERRHAHDATVPALAPADLATIEAAAARTRDSLAPLGEAPPPTARAARDRLAELDQLLTAPAPTFDDAAHTHATAAYDAAVAEARVRETEARTLPTAEALARAAEVAGSRREEATAAIARLASLVGLTVPADVAEATRVIDEARRTADADIEATAEAAGAIETADRDLAILEGRRPPLEARIRLARADLSQDDDDVLDRDEATAREAGRTGDAAANETWRSLHAGATPVDTTGNTTSSSAEASAVRYAGVATLPPRDAVAAEAVHARARVVEASNDVARLRARAHDLESAADDVIREGSRATRADATLRALVTVAQSASTDLRTEVPGDGAYRSAVTAAQAWKSSGVSNGGASAPTHPTDTAAAIADAFEVAAAAFGMADARDTVEASAADEREADRLRASARDRADASWVAATEAAFALGVSIGDRADHLDALPRWATDADAQAMPTRAEAIAAWEAVLADAGAAAEAVAAARRILGTEAALSPDDARARLDAVRRDHRARDRAATILTTTRGRMMAAILPDTQREMARVLPDLTAGRYRFPRLDDRFQLEVYDERKRGWVRRSLFSGGTQDQFSLALRLGFAIAALPREVGTAPGFLFLDEPLSSFDRERARALVDLLRDPSGVVGSHFGQVFLISHSQAFDPGLFAYQIEMEDGRIARTNIPTGTIAAAATSQVPPTVGRRSEHL